MIGRSLARWICGVLCPLGLVLEAGVTPVQAQSIPLNEQSDLAAEFSDPLTGWAGAGAGGRAGVMISSNSGSTRTYTRTDVEMSGARAFLHEAIVSADAITGAGERGARMWAKFVDPYAPAFPLGDKIRHLEVRLLEDAVSNRRFALFDAIAGVELVGIPGDWADPGNPYRVRIKRQEILGIDYIVFQAELASGFDDPGDRNPEPDTPMSHKIPVSSLSFQDATAVPEPNELGFGNHSTPSGDFGSTWRSVHVTGTDLTTEPLPYWPPQPPAPTLALAIAPPPHAVEAQVDLPVGAYLVNDTATLVLDTLSGTLSSDPILDPSASPAQHSETFTGLDGNQTVTGWVEIADVSGRTSMGPVSMLTLAQVPIGTGWFPWLLATALLLAGQWMIRNTAR